MDILFEDEDYIVVNKSAGVLSIPDRFLRELPNLLDQLSAKYGKVYVTHRLDKDTSGVICFARNEEAHKILNDQFSRHEVRKIYFALVAGQFEEKEGRIDLHIGENHRVPGTVRVDPHEGKESITMYKVKEEFAFYSLLEVFPQTGRMHQIRVHMQAIGHPLAVDEEYGGGKAIYLSQLKRDYRQKKDEEEKPLIARLTLHAWHLKFFHFRRKEYEEFEAPLPRDFTTVLKQLRKYGKYLK